MWRSSAGSSRSAKVAGLSSVSLIIIYRWRMILSENRYAFRDRALAQREFGCRIAGPNGTFDGRGQARAGPIAREVKVAERGRGAGTPRILLRRRREGRAALTHHLPGRQFRRQFGDV